MSAPVLTIDGPGATGKGTVSQRVASALGWHYLDSGALYRALAVAAQQAGVAVDDPAALAELAGGLEGEFVPQPDDVAQVRLAGQDISARARAEDTGARASQLAAWPAVRAALLARQRDLQRSPGLVAEGRDMGTVVFPGAEVKIFLTAEPAVRAQRRHKQLMQKGFDVSLPRLVEELRERDRRDSQRAASPLKPAHDACLLDTSTMTIEQVVEFILSRLHARLGAMGTN